MAGEDGFYLMHRGWQDNPVFRGEAFSRRDAFVWLIEEASYTERRVAAPKGEVRLARGQLCASLRFMAKAWKWDEAKVRRFIQSLSNAKIIDARTDAGQTVITVCNYDTYQAPRPRPDAPRDAAATQDRRSTDANEKEGNQGNKGEDVVAGAGARAAADLAAPARPRPVAPDPFGPIGELAARFGQAGGVLVSPTRRDFPDQLDTVREWLGLGLDPETEIVPVLERDARGRGPPRHSLKYFTPALAKIAARKAAPDEPTRDQDHANPLTRAALRAANARAD